VSRPTWPGFVEAFDAAYADVTMTPISKYVTPKEIQGKSVQEVHAPLRTRLEF